MQARHLLVFITLVSATLAGVNAAESSTTPQFKSARQVAPRVRSAYCQENSFYTVRVVKSASGDIGGYILQPAIRDAPIPFLDAEGEPLTSFHIFGSDQEKRAAMALIKPLKEQFPIEQPLDCNAP